MKEDPTAKLEEDENLSPAFVLRAAAERLRITSETMQIGIDRAREHAQNDKRKGYFIGLARLRMEDAGNAKDEATTEALIEIGFTVSRVDNPPNPVHLAHALTPRPRNQYAIFGHLARQVNYELFISDNLATNWKAALNIAHRTIYALRIKTGNLCVAVGASKTSWNQMAAESASLEILLLDAPGASRWSDEGTSVRQVHLEWCLATAPRIFDLYEVPAFRLAFDSAGESPFISDVRTSIARIWAGIEALFDVQQELRYRLSMYAAVLVVDTLEERLVIQRRFKSLYVKRSKAVHGSPMSPPELEKTAYESWQLLCELVDACIRTGPELVSPKVLVSRVVSSFTFGGRVEWPDVCGSAVAAS